MKNKIAGMIFHPPNIETIDVAIKRLYPLVNMVYSRMPPFRKKMLLNGMQPFKVFHLNNIEFNQREQIDLVGYMLPMLPDQMLTSSHSAIKKINRIINKANILGVNVITLGAFTSIVTNQGLDVLNDSRIRITSGNTYTAALCIQSILKLASVLDVNLKDSNMAIIGATGDIGSICAKIFSQKVKKIVLCSRSISESKDWVKLLNNDFRDKIVLEQDANRAIRMADIIICATSSVTTLFDIKEFLPGTVVCDLSMPPNVGRSLKQLRRDVLVYEGGRAKLPYLHNIGNKTWRYLFPKNSIYGCFIESIILTLANKFENFSIGKGNITEEKVNEIYYLGLKYGIDIADFGIEDYLYTEDDLEEFKIKRKNHVWS